MLQDKQGEVEETKGQEEDLEKKQGQVEEAYSQEKDPEGLGFRMLGL